MDDVDTKFNREPRKGMELILLLRVNRYLRTMPLIKWCGLCSTTVVKLRNMWSMFWLLDYVVLYSIFVVHIC
jgi:hypothetical protein